MKARLREPLLLFLTAFRFLTIIPVGWMAAEDHTRFQRSLAYFPLVGFFIGAMGAFLAFVGVKFLPLSVTVLLCMIFLAGVSGCMHLDGLADSADGLLSSRPREVMLSIMKDSRSGVMGVIAVTFCLLLKFAALSSLSLEQLWQPLLIMPVVGRCAILLTMVRLPYARQEGGLGQLFYSSTTRRVALPSLLVALVLLLVLFGSLAFNVVAIVLVFVLLFNRWCTTKLGGATGDTLGAVCEISEAMTALAVTVVL